MPAANWPSCLVPRTPTSFVRRYLVLSRFRRTWKYKVLLFAVLTAYCMLHKVLYKSSWRWMQNAKFKVEMILSLGMLGARSSLAKHTLFLCISTAEKGVHLTSYLFMVHKSCLSASLTGFQAAWYHIYDQSIAWLSWRYRSDVSCDYTCVWAAWASAFTLAVYTPRSRHRAERIVYIAPIPERGDSNIAHIRKRVEAKRCRIRILQTWHTSTRVAGMVARRLRLRFEVHMVTQKATEDGSRSRKGEVLSWYRW